MKFLFIIQGEGRGHFSQSIALEQILSSAKHNICCVMAGINKYRELPEYFKNYFKSPLIIYKSPNFKKSKDNKGIKIFTSLIYNLFHSFSYIKSTKVISQKIKEFSPDAVINFYEPLVGLAYKIHKIEIPHICISHHFLIQHRDFPLPREMCLSRRMLFILNRITSYGAKKILALSFRPMPDINNINHIYVVPPLLREEIINKQPVKENYIMGYMLHYGFVEDIKNWFRENPKERGVFFWDKPNIPMELKIGKNLVIYQLDGERFIDCLVRCKGFISTAGFESVCEAMFLQKPCVVVPVKNHYEQLCNARDADLSEMCVVSKNYNPGILSRHIQTYNGINKEETDRRIWFLSAKEIFLKHLTNI